MTNSTGETNIPVTDWTTGSLKVYQDEKITALERLGKAEDKRLNDLHYADIKRLEEALADLQRAYDKFELSVATRFVEVNEFRKSLDDLGQKMQTKSEASVADRATADKIDELAKQIVELRSRLDLGNPALTALQNQFSTQQGRTLGSDKTIAYMVTAISILFGLIGVGIAVVSQ